MSALSSNFRIHKFVPCSSLLREGFKDDSVCHFSSLMTCKLIDFQQLFHWKTRQRFHIWNSGEVRQSKKKIANLCAQRSQKMPLPIYVDTAGRPRPLNEFLREPAGTESMLNTKALQDHEYLGSNIFRCTLPKLEILNFEVAPVVDLSVVANEQECIVEMLSCKFQGSEVVESQNQRFSASMRNNLTWEMNSEKSTLEVNVELNVSLEVYTLPFTLLPISAVETPGNVILQAMVDRMVPIFLDHLLGDYHLWFQLEDNVVDANVPPDGNDTPETDANGSDQSS